VLARKLTPVTLPPGRFMLATRPNFTGSAPIVNTIGMVEVAEHPDNPLVSDQPDLDDVSLLKR
jgi:hypothetical protein